MAWNPAQYLKFAGPRLQPALDLMARIPDRAFARVVDLGCGTGEQTAMLARRFRSAEVRGVDASEAMLARARKAWPEGAFELSDADAWVTSNLGGECGGGGTLLYSNAALQWLPDHASLFPRLARALGASGVLAVQMPRNHAAPAYATLHRLASSERWRAVLPPLPQFPVLPPEAYYAALTPCCDAVDVWETEYLHVLEGDDPVVEWVRLGGSSRETPPSTCRHTRTHAGEGHFDDADSCGAQPACRRAICIHG